jgi:phytoene synthase
MVCAERQERLMRPADPERALALAYAPASARPALAVLWQLDERLAGIVATTREERLGAIRLAWWREALEKLDSAPPPDEPLLKSVAAELIARGVSGAALGGIADGWAGLLAPLPLDPGALETHATERGRALFRVAGGLLGDTQPQLDAAGEGWALVDLAFHVSDRETAAAALAAARGRLDGISSWRWPTRLRALGALAVLAAGDAASGLSGDRRPASPARVGRALLHRVTGR